MVRILLADDHDVVRRGLREQLSGHEGWEICGEACNGREAVQMALKLSPDVAVMFSVAEFWPLRFDPLRCH